MQMSLPPRHAPMTDPVPPLLKLGYAALHAAHEIQAEALFRRAVELDPLSEAAWRALADTQFGARRGICLRWAEYAAAQQGTTAKRALRPGQRRPALARHYRAAGAAVGFALLLVIGTDIAYRERYLPGVRVGSTYLEYQSAADGARVVHERQRAMAQRVLTLRTAQTRMDVPLSTLLQEHPIPLPRAAFAYGHEPSVMRRAMTRFRAFAGFKHVVDDTVPSQVAVDAAVARFARQVERERRDAQLRHTPTGWQIEPEITGRALDEQQMALGLARLVDTADVQVESSVLTVETQHVPPTRVAADLEPLRQHLNTLAAQPLMVLAGDQRWTLDRSLLMDVHAATSTEALEPSQRLIHEQIEQIARQVVVAPRPSHLVREGGRVRSIMLGQAGHELDRDVAVRQLTVALTTNAESVQLALRDLPPPPGEAEQLGLIEELGRGESQFLTYSSSERDANVQTGGAEIDGVLIAPGQTFSFTQTIGDITWEEGYRWGEMIEAGVVVPSLGGGICQVSTTMFRAAFWSGLEIIERHHHTWRLPWYEVDAPPGMDSTIALGGPDLKVRNNTQHHILIKVETDLEQKRQTVIIYGTRDGRRVAMEPIVGGNIGVRRHVIQGDEAVVDETYMSYYTQ